MQNGNLYIISAPSGAGKSSLIQALLQALPSNKVKLSVSYTTRLPRVGEQEGVHYYFTDVDEFESLIQQQQFLEYARVFDNYYGTSKRVIEENLRQGVDVLLDIDWQGAQQVRQKMPMCRSIFILPPSLSELEQRLVKRGQDSQEVIAKRMQKAIDEISRYNEYDYVLINDDFELALQQFKSILIADKTLRSSVNSQRDNLIQQLLAK